MSQQNGASAPTDPDHEEPLELRVRPSFQFFYSLPLLLAAAILVDALLAPAADKWLFLLLVLALSAVSLPRGWSKVTLEGHRLTLHAPLRRPRPIDLRRLTAIESSPRLGQALLLRYHPDNEQDQPSPAGEAVLALPPLQDQYLLEERIQAVLDLSDKVF
ncbi:MAG: hypothetical protein V9H69_27890 [Anaerolineae bacterium]